MEEKYVILWGTNPDGTLFFESTITIEDQAAPPFNPEDGRVMKFDHKELAELHLDFYSEGQGKVITLSHAIELYREQQEEPEAILFI